MKKMELKKMGQTAIWQPFTRVTIFRATNRYSSPHFSLFLTTTNLLNMKIVLVFLLLISTCFAFAQDASPNERQVYWNGFKGDISVFDANTNDKIIDHLPFDAVENTMYNNVLVVVKNDR